MVDLGIPGLSDGEFIGRGGFGQVYRCRQEALNRTVAVKVLRMHEAGEAELRLFERECSAVGGLAWCPEIVSVYSTGTTPDGDPYMVMEYAPGGSLRDRLQAGTLSEAEARDVAVHMAKALAAAHGTGLLHRDVKPANILISHTGSPILADFGIAKALARSGNTSTAAMSGTIAYLAPELLDEQPATAASDIFSLGATLLEALTGRTPFSSGPNDTAASLMRRALRREEVDLSSVPAGDDFRQILARCLAIDPAARFASGAELLSALGVKAPAPVQEQTMVRPVAPDASQPDDATMYRPRAGNPPMPPVPPPPVLAPPSEATVVRASNPVTPTPGPVPLPPTTTPPPRRNIALAVLVTLGVLALVAGIAVATVLLTRSSENDTTARPDATSPAETSGSEADIQSASPEPIEYRQCWDGEQVESGTPCNTDYDLRAIYFAFDIDPSSYACKGGVAYNTDWGYMDEQCDFPPKQQTIHLAIYNDARARDGVRADAYGPCRIQDAEKQTMRCSGGAENRQLIRYDSDTALFYASGPDGEAGELAFLLGRMRPLDEVLYGVNE